MDYTLCINWDFKMRLKLLPSNTQKIILYTWPSQENLNFLTAKESWRKFFSQWLKVEKLIRSLMHRLQVEAYQYQIINSWLQKE